MRTKILDICESRLGYVSTILPVIEPVVLALLALGIDFMPEFIFDRMTLVSFVLASLLLTSFAVLALAHD